MSQDPGYTNYSYRPPVQEFSLRFFAPLPTHCDVPGIPKSCPKFGIQIVVVVVVVVDRINQTGTGRSRPLLLRYYYNILYRIGTCRVITIIIICYYGARYIPLARPRDTGQN